MGTPLVEEQVAALPGYVRMVRMRRYQVGGCLGAGWFGRGAPGFS